jgi:hypothetical protein
LKKRRRHFNSLSYVSLADGTPAVVRLLALAETAGAVSTAAAAPVPVPLPAPCQLPTARSANKTKRETDVHLRQLAKKSTQRAFFVLLYMFLVRFWAFLGVARQGEFENTGKQLRRFQKFHRGNIFSGGGYFFRVDFVTFFFLISVLRWLSASR